MFSCNMDLLKHTVNHKISTMIILERLNFFFSPILPVSGHWDEENMFVLSSIYTLSVFIFTVAHCAGIAESLMEDDAVSKETNPAVFFL